MRSANGALPGLTLLPRQATELSANPSSCIGAARSQHDRAHGLEAPAVVDSTVHYCSVAEGFAPLDLLYLYREEVLSILNRRGISHPRVCGLAARGAELQESVPVEILVDVMESRAWAAVDLHAAADAIASVIAHPVALVHCPPGAEELLPGEQMIAL